MKMKKRKQSSISLKNTAITITSDNFTSEQHTLIQQSHDGFLCDREQHLLLTKRQAAAVNGKVVTHSESDDCEEYLWLRNVQCEEARVLISKRRKSIRRKGRHLKAKMIAERNFLARKQSHSVEGF